MSRRDDPECADNFRSRCNHGGANSFCFCASTRNGLQLEMDGRMSGSGPVVIGVSSTGGVALGLSRTGPGLQEPVIRRGGGHIAQRVVVIDPEPVAPLAQLLQRRLA